MSLVWIIALALFSLFLTLICYFPNLQLATAQTNINTSGNFSDLFSGDRFTNIVYPSFWERIEIPEINGVLYLSPLKSVGAIAQIINERDIESDRLYTDLILLMRQNLDKLDIIGTNQTRNLIGSNIETIEYSYGNNSKFRIQQTMETGKNQVYLFTFFSENIFYDRHIPIVTTMKNAFLYLNENDNSNIKRMLSETNDKTQYLVEPNQSSKASKEIEITNQMDQLSQNGVRDLVYTNPYLGISLEYPSSLIKKEGDNGVSFFRDQGTVGIILGVIPSSQDSLENFTSDHIAKFKSDLEDYSLTNMSQVNLFNKPTQLIFFKYMNNSNLYEGMEYITMDGTDAYVFSYFAPAVSFDNNLNLFSNIVESIQLRNLPKIT
jgi:hypothetical protein